MQARKDARVGRIASEFCARAEARSSSGRPPPRHVAVWTALPFASKPMSSCSAPEKPLGLPSAEPRAWGARGRAARKLASSRITQGPRSRSPEHRRDRSHSPELRRGRRSSSESRRGRSRSSSESRRGRSRSSESRRGRSRSSESRRGRSRSPARRRDDSRSPARWRDDSRSPARRRDDSRSLARRRGDSHSPARGRGGSRCRSPMPRARLNCQKSWQSETRCRFFARGFCREVPRRTHALFPFSLGLQSMRVRAGRAV